MSGISSSIQTQVFASLLPIVIKDKQYSIGWNAYESRASDPLMVEWTSEVLKVFETIECEVKRKSSIQLDEEFCQKQLNELARWGKRAYKLFFQTEARELLSARFNLMGNEMPAPTFISDEIPFPWELLYESEDFKDDGIMEFWGLKYAPARILDGQDISRYAQEQSLPSDMLFCLHHKLRDAHLLEWPEIKNLVCHTEQGRFGVFGLKDGHCVAGDDWRELNGEKLLKYLYQAEHNMVHFACHCKQKSAGNDVLEVSIFDHEKELFEKDTLVIGLETYTFTDLDGKFRRKPLVFLNACQSAGGGDLIRHNFNLPQSFIKSGAAAVIATICPVPDLFAAAFARRFYQFFLHEPMTIGQALRSTRLHFLNEHHNPLGLAYGLYSPAHYRVAQPLAAAGGFD